MIRSCCTRWFLICISMLVPASPCSAKPITYQGQMLFAGEPASGQFDIDARLFDALFNGNQIGETVHLEDHLIQMGFLNTPLDFGEVYNQDDLYLEFSIRIGDSEDEYTTLLPRQLLTPAPKAFHATTADSLVGPGWSIVGSGFGGEPILGFGSGFGRVVINRSELITPVEYFGVHINDFDIGGIVVSNSEPDKRTLIAHATGGIIGASEIFDGSDNSWKLQIGTADTLVVNSSGITAPNYAYKEPITQAVTVAGDLFHSALGTPFVASFFSAGAYISDAGANTPMLAPVTLPNNATVTKLVARFEDNAPGDLTISLVGAGDTGSLTTLASAQSMGVMTPGIQAIVVNDLDNEPTNTFTTGYYLRAFCNSWPGDSTMRIWSVTIEYTVPAPD